MEEQIILNEHNKQEYPPMHTAEHILNGTMVRMFGCGRAVTAHIERRKSKCDYIMESALSDNQILEIENMVNKIISQNVPVTVNYIKRDEALSKFDLSRLPQDASETLRVVSVGDYDKCLCAGLHVSNTSEIGHFTILGCNFNDGKFRIRFKLT